MREASRKPLLLATEAKAERSLRLVVTDLTGTKNYWRAIALVFEQAIGKVRACQTARICACGKHFKGFALFCESRWIRADVIVQAQCFVQPVKTASTRRRRRAQANSSWPAFARVGYKTLLF